MNAATPSNPIAQTDQAVLDLEASLKRITTLQARFVQTNPDGSQRTGRFYLDRPGKLRFEYDPPIKDLVVADGYLLHFYDARAGQPTSAPIQNTLADFFLRKHLSLTDGLMVETVRTASDGALNVTVLQQNDPLAGSLTIAADPVPQGGYRLKKWRIVDAEGNITETELFNTHEGAALPASLFVFRDPRPSDGLN